eukprot:UN02088
MRVWQFKDDVSERIKMKSFTDLGVDDRFAAGFVDSIADALHREMIQDYVPGSGKVEGCHDLLYGRGSVDVYNYIADADEFETVAAKVEFFYGCRGTKELSYLIQCQNDNEYTTTSKYLKPCDSILSHQKAGSVWEEESPRNKQVSLKELGRRHKSKLIMKQADDALYKGRFEKYIDTLIENDQWEQALAIAPALGMKKWQELCQQYGEKLLKKSWQKAAPYLIGSGNSEKIIQHSACLDFQKSFSLACAMNKGKLPKTLVEEKTTPEEEKLDEKENQKTKGPLV